MTFTRIIGIDPGFGRMGIAVVDSTNGKQELRHLECITTDKKTPHAERLLTVGTAFADALATWHPNAVALERLYFSANVKTALTVAEARGIIRFEAARAGIPVFEYNPADVKIAVTGHGGSDKKQVEVMVKQLIVVPKKNTLDDEYDALAIALTCIAIDGKTITLALSTTPSPIAKKYGSGIT